MSIGTHPMPPSDMAIDKVGRRSATPDHSHSAAASMAFTGKRVGNSSNGGSGDGSGAHPDAPTCRQTTVSVSAHAAKNGSHLPEKIDARPRRAGNSGKLIARKPRPAF